MTDIINHWQVDIKKGGLYLLYCVNCLQPDTRPNAIFTNQICPACLFVLNKEEMGWNDRLERIRSATEKFRNKGNGYDAFWE